MTTSCTNAFMAQNEKAFGPYWSTVIVSFEYTVMLVVVFVVIVRFWYV